MRVKGDHHIDAIDLFGELLDSFEDTLVAAVNTIVATDRNDGITELGQG
jgi:hypothetical protein